MKRSMSVFAVLAALLLMVLPFRAEAAEQCNGIYRQGSKGSCVLLIQKELKYRGFDPGPLDGLFGSKTYSAVRSFQWSAGLTVDGVVGPVTLQSLGLLLPKTDGSGSNTDQNSRRVELAKQILSNRNIYLWSRHVSRKIDNAYAYTNIADTAAGLKAKNSCYENAPCGSTDLSETMLSAMLQLANKYSFEVSSIAGSSHSVGSAHYRGLAFDVAVINGITVSSQNRYWTAFKADAERLGATVLGPGDAGHSTHVHVQFSR